MRLRRAVSAMPARKLRFIKSRNVREDLHGRTEDMVDDGDYDIRDYRAVMDMFGITGDFGRFPVEIHQGRMKLVVDLVVDHISDEHAWFMENRRPSDNPRRDYCIWRDMT